MPASQEKQTIEWLVGRPKWLQEAARRLVLNGKLMNTDVDELLELCIAEAGGQPCSFLPLSEEQLQTAGSFDSLFLESISSVTGVNALNPKMPLQFGSSALSIIYGPNGAGKSGYVRLLKHACGTRTAGKLHPDVFSREQKPMSAQLTFKSGDKSTTETWVQRPLPQLRCVDIYDTENGFLYVTEENEVVFEPLLLQLFTKLTATSKLVADALKQKTQLLPSCKPILPVEHTDAEIASWYESLSAKVTEEEIRKKTGWTIERDAELVDLTRRLAEPDPAAQAQILREQAIGRRNFFSVNSSAIKLRLGFGFPC